MLEDAGGFYESTVAYRYIGPHREQVVVSTDVNLLLCGSSMLANFLVDLYNMRAYHTIFFEDRVKWDLDL